ncbi:MAG: FIST C-terminal domain-containing protein [Deltaproteobacteria bacterium]|jgi:hypothetical protein|nr:FIST C-terminal domain-containing protein [Deltaproteobacteria bacterium]
MIKSIIAQTNEIDEIDLAVVSILAQLELNQNLLANSFALIFGQFDSFAPGLLPAIAQTLPFDIIGVSAPMTTSQLSKSDYSLLTLVVLTSDDMVFSVGISESMDIDPQTQVNELISRLMTGQSQSPKLGFLLGPPSVHPVQADHVVAYFTKALPNCPFFGTLSCDFNIQEMPRYVFFNGECYTNRFSLVLFFGLIKPKFNLISLPEKKALKHRAIISKVQGNILMEVNGINFMDYLRDLGVSGDIRQSYLTMPFLVTEPNGKSKIHMLISQTDEGYAVCTQDIILNSTLGLSGFDETDVLLSARRLTEELKWEQFDFCLILSCLGRNIGLGLNYLAELDMFRAGLGDMLPYVVLYSGGEFCPEINDNGESINSFHNLVLASCRF